MSEGLGNPFVFVLGILLITVAVPTICHYLCQYHKNESDAALKRDMIQRGMSAEEIRLVLEVSSTPPKKSAKSAGVPTLTREPVENIRERA